jgi:Zc3h12a-like Ribonuclease NYN domain/S1 RNA binding domain
MPVRHVIVDGSNLATEGRSMPSLEQLDQAVRGFMAENPSDIVTVVVDASFGHRIDPSEVPTFDDAEAAGEVISPPAGAIGRGDAFLLRIAEKVGATVLSNDSFQEFHGDHPWLFDKGRLVGGKPVPGVGWIFMDRTPVRGQKSREVVKEAKRRKRVESGPGGDGEGKGLDMASSKPKGRPKSVDRAIARATQEVVEPKDRSKRRRRSGEPPSEPVNEPLAFITFIAAHPLGSDVVGSVLEFSSHGVFVLADGARCYVPLSAMRDPPPRRAREVVSKGEERQFVVQAFDPQRRGIELALPGFARIAGTPTDETVEAEIHEVRSEPKKPAKKAGSGKVRKAAPKAPSALTTAREAAALEVGAAPKPAAEPGFRVSMGDGGATPVKRSTAAKKASGGPAKKSAAAQKSGAARKSAVSKESGVANKSDASGKAGASEKAGLPEKAGVPEKVGSARKDELTKAVPPKKAAPVKKAAARAGAKSAAPNKAAAPTRAAPVKKAPGAKKAAPAGDALDADATAERGTNQRRSPGDGRDRSNPVTAGAAKKGARPKKAAP